MGKLTDPNRSHARVLSMNSGRHPLAVDDELVSRPANVDLGDFVVLSGLDENGTLDRGVCCKGFD